MTRATIIDGKTKSTELANTITADTAGLLRDSNIKPGLAVVLVGTDPASHVYVRNKARMADTCGFHSVQHTLDGDVSQGEVLALIDTLNGDAQIHGILVQLPLPKHLDEQLITQRVDPAKDVDGFHFTNIGMLTAGDTQHALVPCTPAGCMLLIEDQHGKDLSGLHAVVIGRSNIVGKPMASLLLKANATVTICHSRTRDLPAVTGTADIVVAAVGRPQMVRGEWIKPGATVIDVGINRIEVTEDDESRTRLVGDVDFEEVVNVAGAVTPVPGGVGPMTIIMLMSNTLKAASNAVSGD